jgi:beta-glucosidase
MPLKELKAFKKVFLRKSERKMVHFSIPASELKKWDLQQGGWKLYSGSYYVCVGKNASDMILKQKITVR